MFYPCLQFSENVPIKFCIFSTACKQLLLNDGDQLEFLLDTCLTRHTASVSGTQHKQASWQSVSGTKASEQSPESGEQHEAASRIQMMTRLLHQQQQHRETGSVKKEEDEQGILRIPRWV